MATFEQRLANGDKNAFERLIRENQNKIYAVCLNMLKNPHDAQDAAQDTFFKAYKNAASFRGHSRVETWLTKIAVNTCLDMLRARKPTVDIDEVYDVASDETTESVAEKNAKINAVRQALARLPDDMRSVVVLRDIEGLSYEEAASALGLNPGTLRSRLSRARERLKKILLENGELF